MVVFYASLGTSYGATTLRRWRTIDQKSVIQLLTLALTRQRRLHTNLCQHLPYFADIHAVLL